MSPPDAAATRRGDSAVTPTAVMPWAKLAAACDIVLAAACKVTAAK
jgi:hypothetical protein